MTYHAVIIFSIFLLIAVAMIATVWDIGGQTDPATAPPSGRRCGRNKQIRVGDNSKYFINRKTPPPQSEHFCRD